MKPALSILSILFSLHVSAQVFNSPESVEKDPTNNNRWIVAQNGSGQIHFYSPLSNTLTSFASGIASGPHGTEVLNGVVYCCDGPRIKGFDISNGTLVFNVNLGASFLNGLTTDGSQFLFATDFTSKRIYRINTVTQGFNIMCTITKTPNGIIYDGPNNRCVFVTWGSAAAIQAMSLADSSISTLYTTALSNLDGITRDPAGYWYFTAWSSQSLQRIDPNFSAAPVSVMSGLSSPADIDINSAADSIGIPNSGTYNNVVFYTGIATGENEFVKQEMNLFPNPASENFSITFDHAVVNGEIVLLDVMGREIVKQSISGYRFVLERGNLPAGMYTVLLSEKGVIAGTSRIIVR